MPRLALTLALAGLLALPCVAGAQADTPPLPALTPDQSRQVQQEIDQYRRDTEQRVARGEITPDEAERLLQWREWQLAQQAAGLAPPPPERFAVTPAPYPVRPYAYYPPPYYAPYYSAPAPVFWGLSVCAGRSFHHGFGSFCI
jgi:hypothetical protein